MPLDTVQASWLPGVRGIGLYDAVRAARVFSNSLPLSADVWIIRESFIHGMPVIILTGDEGQEDQLRNRGGWRFRPMNAAALYICCGWSSAADISLQSPRALR